MSGVQFRGALETLEEEDLTITFLRHALTVIHGFVRETQVYDTVQLLAKAPAASGYLRHANGGPGQHLRRDSQFRP